MKTKKVYLITQWSRDNNAPYYKGQIVKVYTDDFQSVGKTRIFTGIVSSDESALIFSEKSVEDITMFFKDPDAPTDEEKQCLRMNFPSLTIKFEVKDEVC